MKNNDKKNTKSLVRSIIVSWMRISCHVHKFHEDCAGIYLTVCTTREAAGRWRIMSFIEEPCCKYVKSEKFSVTGLLAWSPESLDMIYYINAPICHDVLWARPSPSKAQPAIGWRRPRVELPNEGHGCRLVMPFDADVAPQQSHQVDEWWRQE